jgi:steroid 5-alpha reductase family enzyme
MKILRIVVLLIFTLLVVPVITWLSGNLPGVNEWRAMHSLLLIMTCSVAWCFIVGEITGNNSQVDKLWSLLPIVYVWIVAAYSDFAPRLVMMALLVTVWGIRLTANFALKGAYQWKFWEGEEDYRWKILRLKPEFQPRWKWSLFNLFFISGYQNLLILLFTLPAAVMLQYSDSVLYWADYLIFGLILFFIGMETVADIQQWNFQQGKKNLVKQGKPLTGNFSKGFLDSGLWSRSRHPNYLAEQAIWVCFYLFTISAGAPWINWSISGALLLIILFLGSSTFSEEISAGKYPDYKEYQRQVGRYWTW